MTVTATGTRTESAARRYLKMAAKGLWGMASRRKRMSEDSSPLARVLNLVDLTLLGVGSTLGLGVYVLAGQVANEMAGPGVLISFLLAAVSSFFAGLCYAEFASRVPKAGSAYVYAYVAVGEVAAFIIGWTLILEYAIGTASVTRGVSTYVDKLADYRISNWFTEHLPLNTPTLAAYPDFFSFGIIVLMTGLLAFGVKESSVVNNILTFLNLGTATVAVVTSAIYANPSNWALAPHTNTDTGKTDLGGFLPYGVKGIVEGAGTCFFGFVGFDCIATTSEEAKNPRRNIPWAIVLSLSIITITYCSIAIVLTMLLPYYELDRAAPFTEAFKGMQLMAVMWIVSVGAIFALTTSLLGTMIPLPRIMYAMAQDGLLFSIFARVDGWTKTPLIATVVAGGLSGVLALIFDLDQLIEMMSIGTLLAYTVVCMCVLILRYTDTRSRGSPPNEKSEPITFTRSVGALVNLERAATPSKLTTGAAGVLVFAEILLTLALCVLLKLAGNDLYDDPKPWLGSLLALLVPLIVVVLMLGQQPKANVSQLAFSVPGLPYIPALSLFLNLYLMVNLKVETWVRFLVWMLIGTVLYFSYSLRHSTERLLEIAEKKRGAAAPTAPNGVSNGSGGAHPELNDLPMSVLEGRTYL
ncbi:cationic amino acid transporter 3-like [Frankliniella occidentalis]|uniref:Cationic amino acid transporter 3-like n=1 Tax=Frankliniella occidentalis TaxID=133901 RepID=A0A9C6UDI2_FRAOC|nr:cationic amino acid transporter 3-like [Frankliniella occidentalis]